MKTVYALVTRFGDSLPWSPATFFRTRKQRDKCEMQCRIIAGLRTHKYEEKKTAEEAEELYHD
jgi:hypothetical protein